jgi:hypothetical protein
MMGLAIFVCLLLAVVRESFAGDVVVKKVDGQMSQTYYPKIVPTLAVSVIPQKKPNNVEMRTLDKRDTRV